VPKLVQGPAAQVAGLGDAAAGLARGPVACSNSLAAARAVGQSAPTGHRSTVATAREGAAGQEYRAAAAEQFRKLDAVAVLTARLLLVSVPFS
jgi:hypothetical protein